MLTPEQALHFRRPKLYSLTGAKFTNSPEQTLQNSILIQQIPDWIASNENAFHYYGGVPSLLVPDNLKSAITKADRYDPVSNPVFEEFSNINWKTGAASGKITPASRV